VNVNKCAKYFVNLKQCGTGGGQAQVVLSTHIEKISDMKSGERKRSECARLPGDYGAVLLHLHDGSVQQHLDITQTPAQHREQGQL
jgi:hypothetical protein